jgi:hypothetical protein
VRSLERSQTLIGLTCITREQAEDVVELCSSNSWGGTFVMQGNGSTTNNVSSGGGATTTTIDKYAAQFDGTVEGFTEEGTVSTGLTIVLNVFGQLNYNTLHSVETTGPCVSRLNSLEVVAIGPTEYSVLIDIPPDGSDYTMTAYHIGFATLPVHGTETRTDYERSSICDPPEFVRNQIVVRPTLGLGQGTGMYQGTLTTITNITGTLSTDEPQTKPPIKFKFDWSFKRREVPP